MDFSTRYNLLNAAQKQAVDAIDGPVMVIAGPGTGKTELLSMRAANILASTDTLPENILCLTFTESGATAMRERLMKIIGPAAYKVAIHTFHSFGAEIMNQHAQFFYHGSDFRPADELTSYEIIRRIFDELAYSNPLASKMNGEYTHIYDTLQAISELKRSGLTSDELLAILDANDKVLDTIEPKLTEIFAMRLSKAAVSQLEPLVETIRKIDDVITIPGITRFSEVLADSLSITLGEATSDNSTKPITAWRNLWMKKDADNHFVLKARANSAKLRAASYVYYQYLLRMQEAKVYDFDDMILRVVHAMEVFSELRFNLQEQYQYIMVDEFQDTNLAQMRILYNLTNNEMANGKPNILVVGDDDQAIYSFQGADVGNIHAFLELFPATKRIVLTDNYRSSEIILGHARSIISQGSQRLETLLADMDKSLTPHHVPHDTDVSLVELPTIHDERAWIAKDIAAKLAAGVPAANIAVLTRRHRELELLLPYLIKENIVVNYDKQHNVLEIESIKSIEHIAHILVALFEQQLQDANSLLPELLAHPAFAIAPVKIWQLSLKAQENHQGWLEIMGQTPELQPIHEWLVSCSQQLPYTPLERMIDCILGSGDQAGGFISPIASFYFSTEKLEAAPETYLKHLDGLRTLRAHLANHHQNEEPSLQSLLEFMRLHRELGTPLMTIQPGSETRDAIQLMTAHKSKGQEFDHVYIMGAIDTSWGERVRTRSRLISYPANLPLTPAGDSYDERLRLFFVAATRARSHLTISYSTSNDSGKDTQRASFLSHEHWQPTTPVIPKTSLIETAELAWYQPIISPIEPSMKEALAPLLARYKLSATHVNAFLDVTHGGPQGFLINNLLRFPQAKTPSASYGSAIHTALQRAHSHLVATGKQRPHEDILHDYEESLRSWHLSDKDFHDYLQKGSAVLSTYLDAKYDTFSTTQKAELNFASQSVFIGKAHLTGSLDLVNISDDTVIITDYKTGRPARSWQGRDEYEKIKLHKYKQQLMFYCLLVAGSRDFAKYPIQKAVIQFVEATPQNEIVTLEASFSKDDLAEFSRLLQILWRCITTLNFPDISQYAANYQGILAFEKDLLSEDTSTEIVVS